VKDAERDGPSPETSAEAGGPERGLRWARVGIACVLGLILLGFWVYVDFVRPAPFYTIKYDPEMPYFMNSLATFKSHPYAYVDHPGTPVELIGTGILGIIKVATKLPSDEFVPWMIAHPEVFLRWAHGLLAVGSAVGIALIVLMGRPVRRWRDLVAAASAAALFFAVHSPYGLDTVSYWSHNSFAFPAGTLILLLLWVRLRRAEAVQLWELILWGALAGVLTAVQLYFATWIVGIALALGTLVGLRARSILRGVGAGLAVGSGGVAGFFAATLPVLHRYRELSWWIRGLISHQGRYGGGPPGLTSVDRMRDNFAELWSQGGETILAAALAILLLTAVAMTARRRYVLSDPGWWAAAFGGSAQLLLSTLLILKHPGQVYLLALAAILPVLFLLLVESLPSTRWAGTLVGVAALAVGVGFVLAVAQSLGAHEHRVQRAASAEMEIGQVVETYAGAVGRPVDDITILWGYGTPSRCFALRFGNTYAGGLFGDEIREVCPQEWIFNVRDQVAELPEETLPLDSTDHWDVLVILERNLNESTSGFDVALRSPDTGLVYLVRIDGRLP
jgi:hypothetical protein